MTLHQLCRGNGLGLATTQIDQALFRNESIFQICDVFDQHWS